MSQAGEQWRLTPSLPLELPQVVFALVCAPQDQGLSLAVLRLGSVWDPKALPVLYEASLKAWSKNMGHSQCRPGILGLAGKLCGQGCL